MAADHVAGLLIPNDRVNVPEFVQAAAKLLILRISWLKVDAGIIGGRIDLLYRNCFYVHINLKPLSKRKSTGKGAYSSSMYVSLTVPSFV
ncbi:hypothetical protein D3C75_942850 [compost metagenome]